MAKTSLVLSILLLTAGLAGTAPAGAFLSNAPPAAIAPASDGLAWLPDWLAAFDANGNRVDDRAEEEAAARPTGLVPVIAVYTSQPSALDLARLGGLGALDPYAFHWMPAISARVPAQSVDDLGALPGLVAVEFDYPIVPMLAVSGPATQAREGTSPNTHYNGATGEALGYRGEGMVVAVLDTGVNDIQHAPFAGKFLAGADVSTNLVAGCINPVDDDGHGTHVASTAVGNSASVRGTAYQARLVEIRIALGGSSVGGVDRGLDWILDYNAAIDAGAPMCNVTPDDRIDVATISFGSAGRGGPNAGPTESLVTRLTESGVVVTIAVGNCGPEPSLTCMFGDDDNGISSPGNAAGAIGVANSNDRDTVNRVDDTLSTSSSRGPVNGVGDAAAGGATGAADLEDRYRKPEVAAPGESIEAAGPIPFTLSTSSGTSMSTPHVAGIAALLLQAGEEVKGQTGGVNRMRPTGPGYDANNDYVPGQHPVRDALIGSADAKTSAALAKWTGPNSAGLDWNNAWGYGHVDAFSALCSAWKNVLLPAGATPPAAVDAKCDLAPPPQAHVTILNPEAGSTLPAGSLGVSGMVDREASPSAPMGSSAAANADEGPAFSHTEGCADADRCLFFHRAVSSVGNTDLLLGGPIMDDTVPPWTDPALTYATPTHIGANPRTVFDANFLSTDDIVLEGDSVTTVWYASMPNQDLFGSGWRLQLWKDANGDGWTADDIIAESPIPVDLPAQPAIDYNEFRYTFENVVSPEPAPLAIVIDAHYTDQPAIVYYDAEFFESRIEIRRGDTNIPPAVVLGASTTSGTAPLSVDFSLAATDADGTIASWSLDFGDGTGDSGEGQPPASLSHTYVQPGTVTATFTATDDAGATASTAIGIRVESELGEHVQIRVDDEPEPRAFAGVDTSGTAQAFWSTSVTLTPGLHTITASWFEADGTLIDEDTIQFTAERVNQAPTAQIQGPSSEKKNKDVTFDGTASTDADGAIISYAWELGDGATAEGASLTHRYKKEGTYTVVLTVTDNEGASSYTTHYIRIGKD